MARFLLMAISHRSINRFPVESLREAHNLKDFLEQAGGYQSVEIYGVRETGAGFGELWHLEDVLR